MTENDKETLREALSRLEQMAVNDGCTWDLSANDQAAIAAVLADRQRMAAKLNALNAIAAPSRATPEEPMAQKLCLMSIRRWVDEAVAIHRRENGITTPNGLAGQIAAQVWLHVGDVLAQETPAVCHCGCSRPAHTFYRQGGVFTGCKVCACEAYEPVSASRATSAPEEP